MSALKRDIDQSGRLLRRVHPDQTIFDENLNRIRPTSAAFTHERMSVDAEQLMLEDNVDASFSLRNAPQHHLVAFPVMTAAAQDQAIEHTPCPSDQPDNPYHSEVVGKKRGKVKDALVNASEWLIYRK